jgi:predicted alternative tryptophan synthase beta-subunit
MGPEPIIRTDLIEESLGTGVKINFERIGVLEGFG